MGNCNAKVKEVPDIGAGPPSELALMKKMELKRVLEADGIKRQDGDAWYVVEAAWVQRWLAFIQGDDASKKPGPIRNETLLCHNTETKKWGPKPLLRAARREHMGHYRRVNEHVWALWVGCYAGSGPALWVDTPPFEDSSNWILDPAFRGKGGGGDQARQSGGGSVPPERLWPSSTPNSLAIGDMEDDGVGEENAAKVAAFFDVVLDSPRVSHGAAAAAALAAGTAAAAAAAAPGSGGGNNGNGSGNDSGSGNGGGRLGNGSGNVNGTRSGNGSGNVNSSNHRNSNRSSSNRSSGNRSVNSNRHGSGSIDGRRKGATEEEGTESRVSSTAKQWMYGGGERGSME